MRRSVWAGGMNVYDTVPFSIRYLGEWSLNNETFSKTKEKLYVKAYNSIEGIDIFNNCSYIPEYVMR